jgi:hypothetical protein
VQRRDGTDRSDEIWSRKGIYLSRHFAGGVEKFPINLNPAEEKLPVTIYRSRDQEYQSEVLAINQTVRLPGSRIFRNCLKVRIRPKGQVTGGASSLGERVLYLAPDVGEVKREVYRDGAKFHEVFLSDYALKLAMRGG